MQACSFMEKWHKGTINRKNACSGQVNFFIRRFFFWICLETIKTLDGCFNLLDAFLTLEGFKNCKIVTFLTLEGCKNYKVVMFKSKIDLNDFPQKLLDWYENEKIDKTLIIFLKTHD